MMKNRKCLCIFLLIALKTCAGAKPAVPVLMIDHDNIMSRLNIKANPFAKVNTSHFTEIARKAAEKSLCVIIFVEETLCTEDLSQRDKLGTPFGYLHEELNGKQMIYLPAVSNPFKVMTHVFEPQSFNIFHLRPGEKLHLLHRHKFVYVYFQDEQEMTRADKLRKHDALMKEIYFGVRLMKAGPVVGFYIAKSNPISLAQLKSSPVKLLWPESRGVLVDTPGALFRLTGVFATKRAQRLSFDQSPVVESERRSVNTLSTTMQYSDFHLQFNFVLENHSWKLANVALFEAGEEVGRTYANIAVPWYRSYYCNEPITILNLRDGSSITVSEYQIEPKVSHFRRSLNQATKNVSITSKGHRRSNEDFSSPITCCPYFNTPILAGLLLVAIFASITTWGLSMLMNCHTCDRYDDPAQKPLVIAAEAGG